MLLSILLGPLWPAYTDAYAKGDYDWMKRTYRKMSKMVLLMMAGVALMVAFSPVAYKIWIKNTSLVPWSMTISVGIYLIIHAWDSLQVILINGIGTVKVQTYVTLLGMILHIPLSLFIGRYIGGIGVVWSIILINIGYAIVFTTQIRMLLNGVRNTVWNK